MISHNHCTLIIKYSGKNLSNCTVYRRIFHIICNLCSSRSADRDPKNI